MSKIPGMNEFSAIEVADGSTALCTSHCNDQHGTSASGILFGHNLEVYHPAVSCTLLTAVFELAPKSFPHIQRLLDLAMGNYLTKVRQSYEPLQRVVACADLQVSHAIKE
jgi:hypothetical protein